MSRKKITVVGAGNVGATCAQRLAERDYADVVLVDIVEGLPQGKALDLNQSGPVVGYEAHVTGTNGYDETAGSEIVVITSGSPRKPGMSRDDLLEINKSIVADVSQQVKDRSPDAIVIVVTNPLDALCHVALDVTQFPRQRVIGMAGVPVRQKIASDRLEEIVQRTRDGGAEVGKLLQKGSAFYAPAAGVAEMVDSIVLDQKRVLPCAALCQGEYGIDDLFVGVPVKLGAAGIEEIVEIELSDEEKGELQKSAGAVKEL